MTDGDDRRVLAAGCVLAIVLLASVTAPTWDDGAVWGDDAWGHVARTASALDLLAAGRLHGWTDRFMLGQDAFLFYGPGFPAVVGVVRLLTLGALDVAPAILLTALLSLAAYPVATAVLARAAGLSTLAAGVAAVLVVAVDNVYGVGVRSVFVTSLLPHQVAAPATLLALACVLRVLDGDRRRRVVVSLALATAFVVLTHPISGLIGAVLAALALASRAVRRDRRRLVRPVARSAIAAVAAAGLAATWLVPSLAHTDLQGPLTSWDVPPLPDRLAAIAAGRILFTTPVALAVAAGLVAGWWALRGNRWRTFLVAGPPVALVVAHAAAAVGGGQDRVLIQLANRGLGTMATLAVLPLAASLARVATIAGLRAVAFGVAAVVVLAGTGPARAVTARERRPTPALVAAAEELRRTVGPSGRFATERDFPAEIEVTGITHPDLWLAAASGRDTLNVFVAETSPTSVGFLAEQLRDGPPDALAKALAAVGVTHVVTVRAESAQRLAASPRMALRWQQGDVGILEVGGATPVSQRATPLPVTVRHHDRHRRVLEVDVAADGAVSFAMGWSPHWRLHVDGARVPLRRSAAALLEAELPRGRHEVVLTHHDDGWERAGRWITLLTALAVSAYASSAWMSRRRSLTA